MRQKEERGVRPPPLKAGAYTGQRDYYRSVARGSRTIRASGCNLLKRGRNLAKLVFDWLKIQNGFQNYLKMDETSYSF